jgi:hypothetical protein
MWRAKIEDKPKVLRTMRTNCECKKRHAGNESEVNIDSRLH